MTPIFHLPSGGCARRGLSRQILVPCVVRSIPEPRCQRSLSRDGDSCTSAVQRSSRQPIVATEHLESGWCDGGALF